jgi:hypothetical protein
VGRTRSPWPRQCCAAICLHGDLLEHRLPLAFHLINLLIFARIKLGLERLHCRFGQNLSLTKGRTPLPHQTNQQESGQSERPLPPCSLGGSGVYPKFGAGQAIGVHLSQMRFRVAGRVSGAAANRNSRNNLIPRIAPLTFREFAGSHSTAWKELTIGQAKQEGNGKRFGSVAEENAGSHQN